jgi:hypothetical protein
MAAFAGLISLTRSCLQEFNRFSLEESKRKNVIHRRVQGRRGRAGSVSPIIPPNHPLNGRTEGVARPLAERSASESDVRAGVPDDAV